MTDTYFYVSTLFIVSLNSRPSAESKVKVLVLVVLMSRWSAGCAGSVDVKTSQSEAEISTELLTLSRLTAHRTRWTHTHHNQHQSSLRHVEAEIGSSNTVLDNSMNKKSYLFWLFAYSKPTYLVALVLALKITIACLWKCWSWIYLCAAVLQGRSVSFARPFVCPSVLHCLYCSALETCHEATLPPSNRSSLLTFSFSFSLPLPFSLLFYPTFFSQRKGIWENASPYRPIVVTENFLISSS